MCCGLNSVEKEPSPKSQSTESGNGVEVVKLTVRLEIVWVKLVDWGWGLDVMINISDEPFGVRV